MTMMNNSDTMLAKAAFDNSRYNTDGIDFGSKYASNIKDAFRNDEPWAVAIVEAERASIARPKYLNSRGFGKNTLYGAMHAGLRVPTKFTSPDPTVRDKLNEWARHLNRDFGPMRTYSPDELAQRASNLDAAVTTVGAALDELAQSAEIGADDLTNWRRVLEGLTSFRDAADGLHQVLVTGPRIDRVHLDVDPKRH